MRIRRPKVLGVCGACLMIAAWAMAADSGEKKGTARGDGRPEVAAAATEAAPTTVEPSYEPIDFLSPLPPSTVVKQVSVRMTENGETQRYVDDGTVAAASVLVYDNILGNVVLGTSVANTRIADDISMTAAAGSPLDKYVVQVSGDRGGEGTDLLTPYKVYLALYKSCPGMSSNPNGLQQIPGTYAEVQLADGGVYDVQVIIPFLQTIPLPNSFFIGVWFDRTNTGVVVGAPPTLGLSADRFDFPGFPCGGALGGFPNGPHASFNAQVYVRSSTRQVFAGYRASNQAGPSYTLGPRDPLRPGFNRFGDDLRLEVQDCQMVAYEVAVKGRTATGSGAIEFDLKTGLNNGNPETGGRIAGTRKQVFVFGNEVVVSHHDFDPPIQIPQTVNLTAVTSSDVAGIIAAGRAPTVGTTGNATWCYNFSLGVWEACPLPGSLFGALDVTIYCEGVPPVGACCDMIFTDEENESVCRDVPRRNCATANVDAASPLWVQGQPCADICEGGVNNGLPCTRQADCPGGECPGPFALVPCGLSACCTFDDRCLTVTENECIAETIDDPAHLFQLGEVCGIPGHRCPRGPCLGREGLCSAGREAFCLIGANAGEICDPFLPDCPGVCFNDGVTSCTNDLQCPGSVCARQVCHRGTRDGLPCDVDAHCPDGTCSRPNCEGQPGCEDPFCCTAVCALDSFCCQTHWDEQCAARTADVEECRKGPVNDDCYSDVNGLGAAEVLLPAIIDANVQGGKTVSSEPGFCCHTGLRECRDINGVNTHKPCRTSEDCPLLPTNPPERGQCLVSDSTLGPGSQGVGTIWYKFEAPPANTGQDFSSVQISTCDNSRTDLDTLVQVFRVEEPDLGICTDLTPCSVAAQDCEDLTECVPDEQTACSNLIPIACSDDAGDSCTTSLGSARPMHSNVCASGLNPGEIYYFMIASKTPQSADQYKVSIGPGCSAEIPMENDFCNDAIVLEGVDAIADFDLSGVAGGTLPASFDCPGPRCAEASDVLYNDIWYEWVAPSTGSATIDTCGEAASGRPCNEDPFGCDAATPDTTMVVYEGCDCPTDIFSEIACSSFRPTPCFNGSSVEIPVLKDTCYKIRMGGHRGSTPAGNIEVHFRGCPVGDVTFIDPVDGVIDARQPHSPSSTATPQGITSLIVEGPEGLDNPACWVLCEEAINVVPNEVRSVSDLGGGRYSVNLRRAITAGAVTTVTYVDGDNGRTGISLTSHPGNANGDAVADGTDIAKLIDYVTGLDAPPHGRYSTDIDHSGAMAPGDILRIIDVLNGGGALGPWLDSPLPECDFCCFVP